MRVFIADHQLKVRFALRTLLLRRPGIEVVGEADTAEDLLAQVGSTQPDLLLLHWRLGDGMPKLLTDLKRVRPEMKVIVLSVRQEACREAMAAGAEGFVCKMDPPEKLLAAIELVQVRHGQYKSERAGRQGPGCDRSLRQSSVEGKPEERDRLKVLGFRGINAEPAPQSGE